MYKCSFCLKEANLGAHCPSDDTKVICSHCIKKATQLIKIYPKPVIEISEKGLNELTLQEIDLIYKKTR